MSKITNKYEKELLRLLWRIVGIAAVFALLQVIFPESAFVEPQVTIVFTLTLVVAMVSGLVLYRLQAMLEVNARITMTVGYITNFVNILLASEIADPDIDAVMQMLSVMVSASDESDLDSVLLMLDEFERIAEPESEEPSENSFVS